MKKIFVISLVLLGVVACNNPEEAIKAYQQARTSMNVPSYQEKGDLSSLSVTPLLEMEPAEFAKTIGDFEKKYDSLLSNTKNLPADFVANEKKNNAYYLLYFKSEYYLKHLDYAEEDAPIFKKIEEELSKVDTDNAADFDAYPSYKDLVSNLFREKIRTYLRKYEFNDPWGKILADFNTLKSENIKKSLAFDLLEGISPISSEETNEALIALLKENTKDAELQQKDMLDYVISELNRLKAGQPFPPFEGVVDINDKPVSYKQLNLEGKAIFIDIWATYCPDCRKQLPALEELQQAYKGKPITFVSISVDRDKEAWKAMVKEKKLSGVHLYASPEVKKLFNNLYDLRNIPRFMAVDKDGKIVSINAPMPSDTEKMAQLMSTLGL